MVTKSLLIFLFEIVNSDLLKIYLPNFDIENFSLLIEELGTELKKNNLLLSAAVSPSE